MNLYGDRNHRLLSRLIGIRWAGWETDTYKLQRAGWKLAVEHDPMYGRYKLLMHHEAMRLTAITGEREIEYAMTDAYANRQMPIFEVRHIAPNIEYHRIQTTETMSSFQQIDATPRMMEVQVEKLEDMNIFRLALDKAEEVMIDKADMTVIEHLQAIKELQSDKQRELREKARMQQDRGAEKVSGEVIVQLVDYK